MKTSAVILLATSVALAGCSFRGSHPFPGEIASLQVRSASTQAPVRVLARTSFVGAREHVALSLVPGPDPTTIVVRVIAGSAQPFLGLGIMPVDRTSTFDYDVAGEIPLAQPGTYRFEGLSGEDGRLTALATVRVE
jgi:hypothetical protein